MPERLFLILLKQKTRLFPVLIIILLISCRQSTKEELAISNKFSPIQKTYFIETAFTETYKFISKWEKAVISYSITGNFKKEEINFIKNMMANLPKIDDLPQFKYSENAADIIFDMPVEVDEVQKEYDKTEPIRGITLPVSQTANGYRDKVKILVKPKQSLVDTQITIQHEFMHALGLNGHPKTIYKDISSALGRRYFSGLSVDTIPSKIPDLDSAALSILYNKAIKVKMHKKEAALLIDL